MLNDTCHYCGAKFVTFKEFKDHVDYTLYSSFDSDSESDCGFESIAPVKVKTVIGVMSLAESESDDNDGTVSDLVWTMTVIRILYRRRCDQVQVSEDVAVQDVDGQEAWVGGDRERGGCCQEQVQV